MHKRQFVNARLGQQRTYLADKAQRVCALGMLHDKVQECGPVQRPQHNVSGCNNARRTRGIEQQRDVAKHPPRLLWDPDCVAFDTHGFLDTWWGHSRQVQAARDSISDVKTNTTRKFAS